MQSIKNLINSSKMALLRFPFEMISLVVVTSVVLILINQSGLDKYVEDSLIKVIMMGVLGFNLFLSISIFAQRFGSGKIHRLLANLVIIIILCVYAYLLPTDVSDMSVDILRYLLFVVVAVAMVFLVPFVSKDSSIGLWNYIKELISRLVVSGFFAGIMFVGLAVFLVALDYLFGVKIDEKMYGSLAAIMFILFLFWFFLGGIPDKIEELEIEYDYNKFFKILGQYVLIFLIGLYMILLYAYGLKIAITQDWPKGGVIWLTIWYFFVGLGAIVLLKPLTVLQDGKWVNKFTRWFSVLSLPILLLYFTAIYIRVCDYGFTLNRYYVVLIGLWILLVYVYDIIKKENSVRFYLITAILFVLFSNFGPWGAISLTKTFVYNGLVSDLGKNSILQGGKIQKVDKEISSKEYYKIEGKMRYLISNYGNNVLKDLYSQDLQTYLSNKNEDTDSFSTIKRYDYSLSNKIMKYTGLKAANDDEKQSKDRYFNFSFNDSSKDGTNYIYAISGFNFMFDLNLYKETTSKNILTGADVISYEFKDNVLIFSKNASRVEFDFNEKLKELVSNNPDSQYNSLSEKEMMIEKQVENLKVKVYIKYIYGEMTKGKNSINSLDLKVLIK